MFPNKVTTQSHRRIGTTGIIWLNGVWYVIAPFQSNLGVVKVIATRSGFKI